MFHGRFAVSFGWILGGIDRFLDYFAEHETSVDHPLQVVLISGESGAGKMLSSAKRR